MKRYPRIALDPDAPCYGGRRQASQHKPARRSIEADTPEPIVTPTAYGKHIAVSPPSAVLKIGVIEVTADEARQKFFRSYAKWRSYFVPPIDYQI